MSIKRLPVAFLLGGLALKTAVLLFWRLWQTPTLLKLAIYYDPGAFHFAEKAAGLLFDQRRLAPTPGEAVLFDVFLVIGFGVECLLVGFLLLWLFRRFQNPLSATSTPTMR
jgi:uncharacterized membrane protein AbrB (regulator of aidB expression)